MNIFDSNLRNNLYPAARTPVSQITPSAKDREIRDILAKFPNETFDEITVNLTPEEKNNLLNKLAQLPDLEAKTDEVKKAIDENRISAHYFSFNYNFPLYALLALIMGKISGMAFTTSQLFYNTYYHSRDAFTVRAVPFFKDGAINEEACEIVEFTIKIDQTLLPKGVNETVEVDFIKLDPSKPNDFDMTPEQMRTFFELVQKLPVVEQQFLVVPEIHKPSSEIDYINQAIYNTGFNALTHYQDRSGKWYRLIPSKGMMQAYLLAKSPDEAPLLITSFKLSDVDDMHKMLLEDKRPLCLDFAFLDAVKEADGHGCFRATNDCTMHDFYHGNLMADIPRRDRRKFYLATDILKKAVAESKLEKSSKEKVLYVANKYNDMEHAEYRQARLRNKKISPTLIWQVLHRYTNFVPDRSAWIYASFAEALIEKGDFYRHRYCFGADSLKSLLKELKTAQSPLHEALLDALKERTNSLTPAELVKLSTTAPSYLLREFAVTQLKSHLEFANLETILAQARAAGSHQAICCVIDFVIDALPEFVQHSSQFQQATVNFIRKRIMLSLAYDNLITTAILQKNHPMFEFLIDKSAINRLYGKFTLIQWALLSNDRHLIERLLALGADPNLQPGQDSPTPAFLAASSGRLDLFLSLMQSGAKPITSDELLELNTQRLKALDLHRRVQGGYKFSNATEAAQYVAMANWGSKESGTDQLPNLDAFSPTLDQVD